MISIQNLTKKYKLNNEEFFALNDVSLEIQEGEIFGVIGLSGAGKSTLLRCISLLETQDSGSIYVNQKDVTKLTGKDLFDFRSNMGVVFQGYNLLEQKNVFDNIAFPLRLRKFSKKEINQRVNELLKIVGLEDKAKSYPTKLSGGQKQRVAIARAIATRPSILLLDELTSALDPITTNQILALLKQINVQEKVTMILITHEMKVVKALCHRVAVLNEGVVVECGNKDDVINNPQDSFTKLLLNEGVEL